MRRAFADRVDHARIAVVPGEAIGSDAVDEAADLAVFAPIENAPFDGDHRIESRVAVRSGVPGHQEATR